MNIKKPNAFLFKAKIGEQFQLCVCPRVDGQWSEKDIFYIQSGDFKKVIDDLHDTNFNIIFVNFEKDGEGYKFNGESSFYLKSETSIAEEMYRKGTFFSTIEKAYQRFYEQPEQTSREGIETQTSEEK